jgi:hypothetical protein
VVVSWARHMMCCGHPTRQSALVSFREVRSYQHHSVELLLFLYNMCANT